MRNTFHAVHVAKNFYAGAHSVRLVPKSGNANERSSTTMRERAAKKRSLPSKSLCCGARRAEGSASPDIPTARNVPKGAGGQPVGRPKAGIGENSISIRVQTDIFVFSKSLFLASKTPKKFSEFGKGVS